jgi:hypothetical protein
MRWVHHQGAKIAKEQPMVIGVSVIGEAWRRPWMVRWMKADG